MTEIIPVAGTPGLEVVQGEMIAVKPVCESLGLDAWTQMAKLKKKSWATTGIIPAVGEDGKNREMFCINKEAVPMWLANIDENRVKPETRPMLIAYQKEAAKALNDYFTRGVAVNPNLRKVEEARALTPAEQTKQEIETLGVLAKLFPELHDWSQYQAKASAQLMLGMTVERELEERLVSAHVYLVEHGWKRVTVDGKKRFTDGTHLIHDGALGKEVARLYREKHGDDPKKRVDGASGRLMNMYATADLPLFEEAINNIIK